MRKRLSIVAAVLAVALVAGPALADWYPWDPYKYKQLPDGDVHYEPPLGLPYPTAVAVDISDQMMADDFPCQAYGTVTKLHFWGNWEGGGPPNLPLQFTGFRIGFHTDIPAIPGQKPSQPGQELWMEDVPMSYIQTRPRTWTIGHWYDPFTTDPNHWRAVQATIHEFNVDLETYAKDNGIPLFIQEGTRQQPVTYWLSLQGLYFGGAPEGSRLGWVTTSLSQGWNDDATWILPAQYTGGGADPWTDIKYQVYSGVRHPWTPQSMNMSFVLVTRESVPIPEPAGLGLFGVALLVVRRRRRT